MRWSIPSGLPIIWAMVIACHANPRVSHQLAKPHGELWGWVKLGYLFKVLDAVLTNITSYIQSSEFPGFLGLNLEKNESHLL